MRGESWNQSVAQVAAEGGISAELASNQFADWPRISPYGVAGCRAAARNVAEVARHTPANRCGVTERRPQRLRCFGVTGTLPFEVGGQSADETVRGLVVTDVGVGVGAQLALDDLTELTYLREQADTIQTLDPAVRRELPDAVHQLRVATRRLRSALQAYRAVIPRDAARELTAGDRNGACSSQDQQRCARHLVSRTVRLTS